MIPFHRSQAFDLHRHFSKPSGNHTELERPKRLSQIQSDVALYEGPVSDTWPVSYTCKSDLPHHSVPGLRDRFCHVAAAAAKSLQSCPTLCDPIDGSPPGSPVPGILQARTLEWVAISFSNAWKWKVKVKSLSRVWLVATPWTAAHQAPPSMGFSRQGYLEWVTIPWPLTLSPPSSMLLHPLYKASCFSVG